MVFERDLDRIHAGDAVEILPAAAKGAPVQGTLAHVSDLVDPVTRSATVRVEVDNRQGWNRARSSRARTMASVLRFVRGSEWVTT